MKVFLLFLFALMLKIAQSDAASLRSVTVDDHEEKKKETKAEVRATLSVNGTEVDAEEYHRHLAYLAGYPGAYPASGSAAAAAASAGKFTLSSKLLSLIFLSDLSMCFRSYSFLSCSV